MKILKYVMLLVFVVMGLSESYSLPRFALRAKSQCQDCHTNPTGGEMRNSRGWSVGRNFLPMYTTDKEFEMSNKLNENISFGLDFRGNFLIHMDSSNTRSDFQRMQGSIYTDVMLSEEVDIYARYDFIWQIWEAYGVARILPNGSYIKGGSFVPNFGIRIDDHTAYTRGGDMGIVTPGGGVGNRGLIFQPTYVESGVEVGAYLTEYALLTASIGTANNRQLFTADPTYMASLHIQPEISETVGLFFGGSFASYKAQRLNSNFQPINPNVNMFGGFLGLGIGDFTLQGEYDIAKDYVAEDISTSMMMVEAAFRVAKGIEAVVRYDRFDTNSDVEDDEFSRLVLGFEIFPFSFMEVRPQFRIQMEEPSVENNTALVQFHLYY